ncbi:MAG: TonB-dependent receptor [Myxococcales bacterium]|nr:TonB-dependent receptor [Myxococcales bacterium]
MIREVRSTPGTYDPRQGDFAVAGTLRFDLGWDEPGATAKLTYGSFGERRLFLAYHPKDAPEATFAAAEAWSTDGFGPSRAAQRASALGQHVFSLGHATSLRVLATAFASRFDSAGVLRVADLARGLDRFSTYDPHQGGASSRAQLVLDFGHDEPGAHWSLAPYLVHRSLLLRQDFTGALEDPANGDTTQQENRAWTFGATGHHQRKLSLLSEKDTLEVGFALRTDLVDQAQRRLATLDGRVTRTQVLAKIVATDVGAFVDLALRPLPRLVLRGGFRLDGLAYQTSDQGGEARSAQGAHLGKKLTVDLRAVSALHVVASYGEGFRSPQARALADGERTPFTTVRSLELGVRWSEVSVVAASASVFHTSLSDDLAFDPATARNQRVPATRRIGGAAGDRAEAAAVVRVEPLAHLHPRDLHRGRRRLRGRRSAPLRAPARRAERPVVHPGARPPGPSGAVRQARRRAHLAREPAAPLRRTRRRRVPGRRLRGRATRRARARRRLLQPPRRALVRRPVRLRVALRREHGARAGAPRDRRRPAHDLVHARRAPLITRARPVAP